MPGPFPDPPKPVSQLGYQRVLCPTAAIRVAPLCLGGMNFGNAWESFMGSCDKATTFQILDHYYEQGGNFIDTANNYQSEESELWIGEWMKERNNRHEIVLATKFTMYFPNPMTAPRIGVNYAGNSTKSLHISVEASLKKLQIEYIDLLYVHWWDFTTSIPELMQSLNHLIQAGKVLYLGISDTPAWVVSKANEYARNHGLRGFSVYQGLWSALDRDFERDILPMARDENMALCPWGSLGSGHFTTEEKRKNNEQGRKFGEATEKHIAVSKVLEAIAKEKGTGITSIALAYVRSKYPYVYPIVGGRNIDHLKGNIKALELELTDEEVQKIESAVPFHIGFPMSMLFEMGGAKYSSDMTHKDVMFLNFASQMASVAHPKPPKPHPITE